MYSPRVSKPLQGERGIGRSCFLYLTILPRIPRAVKSLFTQSKTFFASALDQLSQRKRVDPFIGDLPGCKALVQRQRIKLQLRRIIRQ